MLSFRPAILGLSLTLVLTACNGKEGDDGEAGGSSSESSDTDAPIDTDTDTPTSTGTDTDAGTDTDTGEPVAGCACAEGDPCSVPLCEEVAWTDELEGPQPELDAALTCALEALRDGKTGTILWSSWTNSGQFTTDAVLELFGDGTARETSGGDMDLCSTSVPEVVTGPLEAAQFFTDCLAEPLRDDRFNCVRGALASTMVTCVEGEIDCSGI